MTMDQSPSLSALPASQDNMEKRAMNPTLSSLEDEEREYNNYYA